MDASLAESADCVMEMILRREIREVGKPLPEAELSEELVTCLLWVVACSHMLLD